MTDRFIPIKSQVSAEEHHSETLGAAALTLSVPLQADGILMQALSQNIRYTLDGTTPTASKGFQLVASDPPLYIPLDSRITLKFFREASGAVLEYEYSVPQ